MRTKAAAPSAIRFSQASGELIEGSRPRSCLNLKARLASSLRLLRRQAGALGGDRRRDLLQALLAHGLGEDRVGLAERIDAVDQVDVQFAHVHGKLAHAVDEGGVGARLVAVRAAQRDLLGLSGSG